MSNVLFILLALGVTLALSACGGTSAPPTPSTVQSPSHSPAGDATTSVESHGCAQPSAPPLPPNAGAVSTATGDFDGDGAPDQLMTYMVPGEDHWHVRVVLADGYALDQQIREAVVAPHGIPSEAIGGYDVDGDGADEAFVTVGNGAYTLWVGLYHFDTAACSLDRVLAPAGPPAVGDPYFFAPVGASVRHHAGLECVTVGPTGVPALAKLSGESEDGHTYQGTREYLTLTGHQLTSVLTESAVFAGDEPTLKCGGLVLGWPRPLEQ